MDSSLLIAALLGLVEGVTEFLPISSTGHMVLVGNWIGFTGEKANSFEIVIQFAAILAVVLLYWKRFLALLPFSAAGRSSGGLGGYQGMLKIGLACGPLFVTGALFGKKIKAQLLFPFPVAVALIVGGIVLLFIEKRKDRAHTFDLDSISVRQAFLVGLFQCCALWPGVSRSGSMIVGGLLLGMTRMIAAEFSFLVAVPIMTVASLHELWESRNLLTASDLGIFAVGFAVAFFTAILAIRFFLGVLARSTLVAFGWYRIILGAVVIALLGF